MSVRNSITNTKKFFQKTIDNFKSFLSIGTPYQKLPKTQTPPFNGVERYHNNNELDYFYTEFTHQWDSRKSKTKNRAQKKKTQKFFVDSCQKENCNITPEKIDKKGYKKTEKEEILKSQKLNLSPGILKTDLCSRSVREKRLGFVAEKLKDLEVIDKGNVDHKLDFEEFLHCYSSLTCPAYLDIVDKFLTEMCREFLGPQQASLKGKYSRPVLQALKV